MIANSFNPHLISQDKISYVGTILLNFFIGLTLQSVCFIVRTWLHELMIFLLAYNINDGLI
jgi:hypothetical protein